MRPVRIIVNVTAGGGVDTTARVVAQHYHSVFNQPFVVDNRTGAGGGIGIELVAKAAPDGYTLLVASSGIVTNAAFRSVNYDPVRDFQPVSNLTSTPYIVVVTPSLPVASIKDLIALAKLKPGAVSYANSGPGSITHLGAALLPMLSGIKPIDHGIRRTHGQITRGVITVCSVVDIICCWVSSSSHTTSTAA